MHRTVSGLAAPGRELERAGGGLSGGLSDAADRADGVPLVGGGLRAPLDAAAGAGDALARAGAAQQEAVGTLALCWRCCSPGSRRCGRWDAGCRAGCAGAASRRAARLRDDVELLALRAAPHRPLVELARPGPEPVAAWRRGDPGAAEALAALELRAAGLRAPGTGAARRA